MKALKAIAIAAVVVAFIGCDDDWIMDLEPPFGGYIWRVSNGTSGYVGKLNPVDATWIEGYGTPFGSGFNYDAAAGDGRVWVAGLYRESDGIYYPRIWEIGGDIYWALSGKGLTWDGTNLWLVTLNGSTDLNDFYKVNPDTHELEFAFTYNMPDIRLHGLAWDGDYLWAVSTHRKGYIDWNEFIQIDPQNGAKVRSIPCPAEGPRGLTWDGEALWVNDAKSDRLYRVSPKDGSILGYHEMSPPGRLPPPAPYGLAFEFPSE